jgi:hypothetical protein
MINPLSLDMEQSALGQAGQGFVGAVDNHIRAELYSVGRKKIPPPVGAMSLINADRGLPMILIPNRQ